LFFFGSGSWHHFHGCACIEVRVHSELLTSDQRLRSDEFSIEAREQLSEDARNAPSHQYLVVSLSSGMQKKGKLRWSTRIARRKREDPARPAPAAQPTQPS
jgi:hypothetical protein